MPAPEGSSELLKGALATSLRELGLLEDLGALRATALQIQESTHSLQTLLQVQRGRAQLAEFQLEELLRDILPQGRFHIRTRVTGFGIPDAHIDTPDGLLCIDAKFPLDNYRRMVEVGDEQARRAFVRSFRQDVSRHVDKIASTYVKPESGGLPFALGFIPSEAVYQYLTEVEGDLLREAASKGVNLVSPSTIVPALNLLATSLRAGEIGARAQEIEENLGKLESLFESFDSQWGKLKDHLTFAYSRMQESDRAYDNLWEGFRRIARLEGDPSGLPLEDGVKKRL